MTTETMTIHDALCELKLLAKKISNYLTDAAFCTIKQNIDTVVNGITVKDVETSICSSYDKIQNWIARFNAIKSAVTQSNSETKIKYTDSATEKEITAAQAIYLRDTGLSYQKELLKQMKSQYVAFTRKADQVNDRLTQNANDYVSKLYGSNSSVEKGQIESERQKYIENHTVVLVDPLNINNKINQLESEIDETYRKIDSALSVSNATTSITFTY